MIKNRLLGLTLACAILAVTVIESASAADYYYSYSLMSYIDPIEDYVAINTQYQPSGNPDVVANDRTIWYNAFYNARKVPQLVASPGYVYPLDGGYIEDIGERLVPGGQYVTSIPATVRVSVNPSMTYEIYTRHRYFDGSSLLYSDFTENGMKFH